MARGTICHLVWFPVSRFPESRRRPIASASASASPWPPPDASRLPQAPLPEPRPVVDARSVYLRVAVAPWVAPTSCTSLIRCIQHCAPCCAHDCARRARRRVRTAMARAVSQIDGKVGAAWSEGLFGLGARAPRVQRWGAMWLLKKTGCGGETRTRVLVSELRSVASGGLPKGVPCHA